jgi:hypothetical protein
VSYPKNYLIKKGSNMKRIPVIEGRPPTYDLKYMRRDYGGLMRLPHVRISMEGDTWEPELAEDVHVPYGAIIGDVCGSHYNGLVRTFGDTRLMELIHSDCTFTANTVLTAAVADAISQPKYRKGSAEEFRQVYSEWMAKYPFKQYPDNLRSIGESDSVDTPPYIAIDASAWVSPISWMPCDRRWGDRERDVRNSVSQMGQSVALSWGDREGVATIVFMLAYHGYESQSDKERFCLRFGMPTATLEELRVKRGANRLHLSNTKLALRAFFESRDFVSAIQNAISLGGDCATIAAITGSMAEAAYREIPQELIDFAKSRLPEEMVMAIEGTNPQYTQYCTDEKAVEIRQQLEIERLQKAAKQAAAKSR